jgi:hypothetical protein
MTNNVFSPGPTPNTVRSADGNVLTAPEGWVLLPPGDAALTRRVKAAGPHWIVQEKKGRKVFSRGVWAPAATIEKVRAELEVERSTEGYAKRREADARRRDKAQAEYVEDFHRAVMALSTLRLWINAYGPAFKDGEATLEAITSLAAEIDLREIPGAEVLRGWMATAHQRWCTCQERVHREAARG